LALLAAEALSSTGGNDFGGGNVLADKSLSILLTRRAKRKNPG